MAKSTKMHVRRNSIVGLMKRALRKASKQMEVPEDVKDGQFAVVAVSGDDGPKRFVVSLRCLSHPTFLRLLEKAEEEFGFSQEGPLTIPCQSSELEKVLGEL
ncbi:hypothetical protein QJS10_CPB21g00327 [Acorus calamus]|uniref:Uncharacterized protein n=1 Tax=Acorus calamus TaxID=4465 RepID=A0AAV9C6X7_ACOCL|nr:hypothetical protein QJS10_CPB21g00327 [Acorus calamus]